MSTNTYFTFLNANDPAFLAAVAAPESSQIRENWEDEHGDIQNRPGAPLNDKEDAICDTGDEYGGWIIDLSKIPKETTHVAVYRC